MKAPFRREVETFRSRVNEQQKIFANRNTEEAARAAAILRSLGKSLDDHIVELSKSPIASQANSLQLSIDFTQVPTLFEKEPPPKTLERYLPKQGPDVSKIIELDRTLRFSCSGLGIGDALVPLISVKALGGGEYHLTCFDSPFSWSQKHPYNDKEYRVRTYYDLADFIASQPYITCCEAVEYDVKCRYDIDFDGLRRVWSKMNNGTLSLLEVGNAWLKMDVDLSEQWLWPTIEHNDEFENKIIVNATDRRPVHYLDFSFLEDYGNRVVFIGIPSDYRYWKSKVGVQLEFWEAPGFSELSAVLNTASTFIAGSSSPALIADAMNVPIIFCKSTIMAHFKPFTKGSYFVDTQGALEKAVHERES